MKNKIKHTTEMQQGTLCIAPVLGRRVPDYVVHLLNDEESESVEQHLSECDYCRETYLTIIRIRDAGRQKRLEAQEQAEADSLVEALEAF